MNLEQRRYFFRVFIKKNAEIISERIHHFPGVNWAKAMFALTDYLDKKGLHGYEIEDIGSTKPSEANSFYSLLQRELDLKKENNKQKIAFAS